MDELYSIIKEKDHIISLQSKRISDLKDDLLKISNERDSLIETLAKSGIFREKNNTSNCVGSGSQPSDAGVARSHTGVTVNTDPLSSTVKNASSGGIKRVQRQRSFKGSDSEIRRSRQAEEYELSEDLREKQIEMLERKYGGSMRTRHAARIIQRAFRQYSMSKNFEKLRSTFGDRRVSKRLSELGRSSTVWSDQMTPTFVGNEQHGSLIHVYPTFSVSQSQSQSSCVTDILGNVNGSIPLFSELPPTSRKPMKMNTDRGRLKRVNHVDSYDLTRGNSLPNTHPSSYSYLTNESSNNSNNVLLGSDVEGSTTSESPQVTPNQSLPDFQHLCLDIVDAKEENFTDNFFSDQDMYNDNNINGSLYPVQQNMATPSFRRSLIHLVPSEPVLNGDHKPYYDRHPYSSQRSISLRSSNSSLTHTDESSTDNYCRLIGNQYRASSLDPQFQYYMTHSAGGDIRTRVKNTSDISSRTNHVPASPTSLTNEASPIWKRKNNSVTSLHSASSSSSLTKNLDPNRMSNISETSEPDSVDGQCYSSSPSSENVSSESMSIGSEKSLNYQSRMHQAPEHQQARPIVADKLRKRLYRIGLNLFNKKPEKGIYFLVDNGFIEESPAAVARFLISRKGLSKQMIGEYLGNLLSSFNQEVLDYFCGDIDLSGLQVDVALRKFQSFFRLPGEAQKIERLMEAFAQRYCVCNPDQVKKLKSEDAIFLLAFAIIMLNTDMHNSSVKAERKMKIDDFIRNLRGIDSGLDLDRDMLAKMYERVRQQEFRPGVDHVSQVLKVEQTIVGKKQQLALPHRRLVCYCRLYEVHDPNKKEKVGLHQREVFLFNDILLVTKIFNKKKTGITYSFKYSFPLYGMQVYLFQNQHYQHGMKLTSNISGRSLIAFNARNDHDRQKFVEDLKDAILETNGMETIRIEEELSKHRAPTQRSTSNGYVTDDSRVLGYDGSKSKMSAAVVNRSSAQDISLEQTNPNLLLLLCEDEDMKRQSCSSWDSGVHSSSSVSLVSVDSKADTLPRSSKRRPSLPDRLNSKTISAVNPDMSSVLQS